MGFSSLIPGVLTGLFVEKTFNQRLFPLFFWKISRGGRKEMRAQRFFSPCTVFIDSSFCKKVNQCMRTTLQH
jgi:hypothetical protein